MSSRSLLVALVSIPVLFGCGGEASDLDGTFDAELRGGVKGGPKQNPTAPAPTEPAVTQPAPTEPAATEPAATEPAATEPAATEPAPTEPAATEPAATADLRRVTAAVASTPTKAIISFAGTSALPGGQAATTLWIEGARMSMGTGTCSGALWLNGAQAGVINLSPGQTYSFSVQYADGTRSQKVSLTMPALGTPEFVAPVAVNLRETPSCGTAYVDASDETGIGLVEFFVDGVLISSMDYSSPNVGAWRLMPVVNGAVSGTHSYYVNIPAALRGTVGTLQAVVKDVFGNSATTYTLTQAL